MNRRQFDRLYFYVAAATAGQVLLLVAWACLFVCLFVGKIMENSGSCRHETIGIDQKMSD